MTDTDQPTDHAALTLEEAAGVLGISVNAVLQRIKRGTIQATKTRDVWLVDVSDRPTTDHSRVSPTDH